MRLTCACLERKGCFVLFCSVLGSDDKYRYGKARPSGTEQSKGKQSKAKEAKAKQAKEKKSNLETSPPCFETSEAEPVVRRDHHYFITRSLSHWPRKEFSWNISGGSRIGVCI